MIGRSPASARHRFALAIALTRPRRGSKKQPSAHHDCSGAGTASPTSNPKRSRHSIHHLTLLTGGLSTSVIGAVEALGEPGTGNAADLRLCPHLEHRSRKGTAVLMLPASAWSDEPSGTTRSTTGSAGLASAPLWIAAMKMPHARDHHLQHPEPARPVPALPLPGDRIHHHRSCPDSLPAGQRH